MRPNPDQMYAGLTCTAVMTALSAYADGEIDREMADAIEAHVAECRQCEQFGAAFGRLLATMRTRLQAPDAVPVDVSNRLREALSSVGR